MKKICIIGIGGAAASIFKEITKIDDFHFKYLYGIETTTEFKYGYISTYIEEIHRIQRLENSINIEIQTSKDMYEPIIDRKITRKINYMAVGKETTRGLGCNLDVEKAIEAYKESEESIKNFLKQLTSNANLVITVAGIGAGTGTGITPLINNYMKSLGIPIVTFVQKPFEFEGKKRSLKFEQNIELFKNSADDTIIINSDELLESMDKHTGIIELFKELDICVAKEIEKYLAKYLEE